ETIVTGAFLPKLELEGSESSSEVESSSESSSEVESSSESSSEVESLSESSSEVDSSVSWDSLGCSFDCNGGDEINVVASAAAGVAVEG
ncbi:hypothetical protein A2U01_0077408, partial [Trifolium medium]|nr:hypothetical protein [Trifolium medium]